MEKNKKHIALCVNDTYVEYIVPCILSIVKNNNPSNLCVHVLSDFISDKMKQRLLDVAQEYSSSLIRIHIVNDLILRGLKDTWTIYTWYRVLLPEILDADVHRVLYLDADVIVAGNIEELFQLDMTNKAIAGTLDFLSKNRSTYQRCGYDMEKGYVCAGVLLMNLDYWREHDIANKVIRWGRDNNERIEFPDQDAINYICRDIKILLPLKYNIVDGFFRDDFFYVKFPEELRECVESPAIIHYAGQAPWIVELSNHLLQDEWEKYNKALKKPVRKLYQSKGLLKVKVIVYKLFHFNTNRKLKRQDVIDRLKYDS